MSINRRAPKRDKNEPEIVQALRSVGAYVWYVSGEGIPDLLVCYGEECFLLEVKSEKGTLTEAQQDFASDYNAHNYFVVRSSDEALKAIGAI